MNDSVLTLEQRINIESEKLDNLTSSYYSKKEEIEKHIQEAENNRTYTHSKDRIKKEKFQERIVVYPKDWCRIT